jgi:hypothetical protein
MVLFAADNASADNEWTQGWYAGGGISVNDVSMVNSHGFWEAPDSSGIDTGFVVSGGYRWSRYIAFELGYLDGGAPEYQASAELLSNPFGLHSVDIQQETTAVEASIVGILPLWNGWEIYIKGGAAVWDASSNQVFTPVSNDPPIVRQVDASGTDLMLGIGGGVTIGNHVHVRLEYQAFSTSDELLAEQLTREARFDLVCLQLHWRF